MKKLLVLVSVLFTSIILTGCSEEEQKVEVSKGSYMIKHVITEDIQVEYVVTEDVQIEYIEEEVVTYEYVTRVTTHELTGEYLHTVEEDGSECNHSLYIINIISEEFHTFTGTSTEWTKLVKDFANGEDFQDEFYQQLERLN